MAMIQLTGHIDETGHIQIAEPIDAGAEAEAEGRWATSFAKSGDKEINWRASPPKYARIATQG